MYNTRLTPVAQCFALLGNHTHLPQNSTTPQKTSNPLQPTPTTQGRSTQSPSTCQRTCGKESDIMKISTGQSNQTEQRYAK